MLLRRGTTEAAFGTLLSPMTRCWATLSLLLLCASVFPSSPVKIALITAPGGIVAAGLNAQAYEGARLSTRRRPKIRFKSVSTPQDKPLSKAVSELAAQGFELILAVGPAFSNAIERTAKKFPKTDFLIVDGSAKGPNIRSVLFDALEGGSLMGIIAALSSKNKVIGLVGNRLERDFPDYEAGFRRGARSVVPKIKILVSQIGVQGAEQQIRNHADIIFSVTSKDTPAVFEIAKKAGIFSIGIGANLDSLQPGFVLTTLRKRYDRVIADAIHSKVNDTFKTGIYKFGRKEKVLDFTIDAYNRMIFEPAVEIKVHELEKKQLLGSLTIKEFPPHRRS